MALAPTLRSQISEFIYPFARHRRTRAGLSFLAIFAVPATAGRRGDRLRRREATLAEFRSPPAASASRHWLLAAGLARHLKDQQKRASVNLLAANSPRARVAGRRRTRAGFFFLAIFAAPATAGRRGDRAAAGGAAELGRVEIRSTAGAAAPNTATLPGFARHLKDQQKRASVNLLAANSPRAQVAGRRRTRAGFFFLAIFAAPATAGRRGDRAAAGGAAELPGRIRSTAGAAAPNTATLPDSLGIEGSAKKGIR